ncbi:DUF3429 domain-containing protein [Octadecabacter sp. SW4]|uniref:DUF3429 domain-containing protein n=1 Tax=Octadecabacter sp. SW4 TaxID=2602067 RepID=UPI0011C20DAA|nr:DUF3429 domain-containing protein [Octadecabacter sp. SW4]QEE34451.1 DUF3429 domain-containing protein [Octadecabacter sp. SW4]
MRHIPRSALILGLLGLLPFLLGAVINLGWLTTGMSGPNAGGYWQIIPADGRVMMIRYGTIILAFMSGILWGFATRATGTMQASGYVLSVIPALWAFFMISGGPVSMASNLLIGFLGLLILDWHFWRYELAPPWWMHLRVLLTVVVVACLLTVVF